MKTGSRNLPGFSTLRDSSPTPPWITPCAGWGEYSENNPCTGSDSLFFPETTVIIPENAALIQVIQVLFTSEIVQ
jgi:hypothetical protein